MAQKCILQHKMDIKWCLNENQHYKQMKNDENIKNKKENKKLHIFF